jgi:GTPase
VIVTEIRCFKISVSRALAGQTCSIAVRPKEKGSQVRVEELLKSKMIMIDSVEYPKLRSEFEVKLTLYSNESELTINSTTEIYVYSETFKQVCNVSTPKRLMAPPKFEKNISKSKDKSKTQIFPRTKQRSDSEVFNIKDNFEVMKESIFHITLKSGEPNFVNLKFKFRPQFVRVKQKIVIYTPKLKAVGTVSRVFD